MERYDAVIIGSGAAGYSTADWLYKYGLRKIAVLTENNQFGTSRNAGSDKQTYYKMSLTDADSPEAMAESLTSGGCVHGDTAYTEAVNSIRCFMRLVEYGVPFPTDEYGRYIGYRTDHDESSRATSAGPLTSKYMTECLERVVKSYGCVNVKENAYTVKIVVDNHKAAGVICLERTEDGGHRFVPIAAGLVVMATGGAASVYRESVYPPSQKGALGLAIDAGCKLNNLTEWQYGIASVDFRWNLSGSYQQVIPRYFSEDESGEEHEFLSEYFSGAIEVCNAIFLKGYQWPFDSAKISGSSRIDLAVGNEMKKGRTVYMDFTRNPTGYCFDGLSNEAHTYLAAAKAEADTPYERLSRLNPQAIEVYYVHNIDLAKEPLRVSVCAQHMNGGVAVDCDWQTGIGNLFAVGECAGTFGLTRPGGAALNSTQVGGLRIAAFAAAKSDQNVWNEAAVIKAQKEEEEYVERCLGSLTEQTDYSGMMSECAAHIRSADEIERLSERIRDKIDGKEYRIADGTFREVEKLYSYRDTITSQYALCRAILSTAPYTGSRGGSVFYTAQGLLAENTDYRRTVSVTEKGKTHFEALREIPHSEENFELIMRKRNNRV